LPINDGPETDRSAMAPLTVDADQYGKLFPCRRCTAWFVTVDRYDERTVIREWHDRTCPMLLDQPLAADD
jgi:hypothetical protein